MGWNYGNNFWRSQFNYTNLSYLEFRTIGIYSFLMESISNFYLLGAYGKTWIRTGFLCLPRYEVFFNFDGFYRMFLYFSLFGMEKKVYWFTSFYGSCGQEVVAWWKEVSALACHCSLLWILGYNVYIVQLNEKRLGIGCPGRLTWLEINPIVCDWAISNTLLLEST